jgi:ATP-dependent DNA helicase RecQ
MVFVWFSPVALMKDQVANLQKIKAIALTGGIRSEEMIDLLDNCHRKL